jgi:hypothetical protein
VVNFPHAELLDERFPNHCKYDWKENALLLDLEWTRRGATIFLRPRDAPLEIMWSGHTNGTQQEDSMILEGIYWSFRRRDMTRWHRFGDTLIFINRNQGVVPHLQGMTQGDFYQRPFGARFMLPKKLFPKFQKPQVALLAPPELVEAGLTHLAQDEQSDFNIARRWLENYRDSWPSFEYTILTREEVEDLLISLWFIYGAEHLPSRYSIPVLRRDPQDKVVAFISSARWNIPERLVHVFNSNSGLKIMKRGCTYSWGTWHGYASSRGYYFDIPAPNEQQRRAAIRRWREFLHDKMVEEEINSLLPSM